MHQDLNQIRVFTKVVECKSFIRASRELDIPKSTVSRKIAELEDRIGVQLLYRTSRSLSLTDAGAVYFEHCSQIMEQIEAADLVMANSQQVPSGKLRVSMPENTGMMFNHQLIEKFLETYPKIKIEIIVNANTQTRLDEGIDVAFMLGPLPDSSLIAKRVSRLIDRLYASPAYLEGKSLPRHPTDLANLNCIDINIDGYHGPWQFTQGKTVAQFEVEGRLTVPSLSLAHQAALNGLGIAKLPNGVVKNDVTEGRLVSILEDWWFEERSLYMVYPSRSHIPLKLRAFIHFLEINSVKVGKR